MSENNKYDKTINILKKVRKTVGEDIAMRFALEDMISKTAPQREAETEEVATAYVNKGKKTFFSIRHLHRVIVMAMIIFLPGFGFTAIASANSMPGDILYKTKINITENLQLLLMPDRSDRLEFQINRIDNRFEEIEHLIKSSGGINESLSEDIVENIVKISSDIMDEIEKSEHDGRYKAKAHGKLFSELDANKRIIESAIDAYGLDKDAGVVAKIVNIADAQIDAVRKRESDVLKEVVAEDMLEVEEDSVKEVVQDKLRELNVLRNDMLEKFKDVEKYKNMRSSKFLYYKIKGLLDSMDEDYKEILKLMLTGDYEDAEVLMYKVRSRADVFYGMMDELTREI